MNLFRTSLGTLATGLLAASALLTSCGEAIPDEASTASAASGNEKLFPIAKAFEIVAKENDVARKLFTKGIVGPGKKAGIKFDEDWRKDDVEAGPLPALFLRGISADIQKKGEVPLGLFLGSDYPVNNANKFQGKQAELFTEIKGDRNARFFYDEDNTLHTAMFPDFAAAAPCVNCHNDHPESPKKDWVLGDVMGATTWTYPKDSVTFDEVKGMIMAYRMGAMATLDEWKTEIEGFKESEKPAIGEKWPTEGMFIPSSEAFMDSVKTLVSANTLAMLLEEEM